MSTVPSSSRGIDAELPQVLDAANGANRFDREPVSAPHFVDRQLSNQQLANQQLADEQLLQTSSYSADVEVLVPDDSLTDTVTYRLDDTELEIPVANHLSVEQQTMAQADPVLEAAVLDSAGTLVLKPPTVSGPLDGLVYAVAKRVVDVAVSSLLLILLSPVLLISALLVKLTDGGAVFYPHTRVGEGGNEFTCYKFRSMVINADKMKANLAFFNSHDDQRTFKIPDDPRVTWIGRWMRRTSIDELPQLWNVLKGEMSVVGPRPPVVCEVEQYTWEDMQRLTVKPGLTCIWQVSGRSRLPFPEQLRMDLEYIENRSLALDLKLIALTVPAVLSADGAY